MTLGEIMKTVRERMGCTYPDEHPEYCDCLCCKEYQRWLKDEYPTLLKIADENGNLPF
ncbi:MAG: hypothetical protein M0R06_02850 [Sphaerochaeta sp.]|jgi:hypothetical protein|nr:hypothetical protein [Sphaerochaeta sp.]